MIRQTDRESLFRRYLSRPKSFWSTCTKSPWSTSSRRTPCCTATPSPWPPWCGCGSGWSLCEPTCSAAGRLWPRICAAGRSRGQAAPLGFPLPPARGGWSDDLPGLHGVHPLEFCGSPSRLIFDFFPPKSSPVEPRKMKVISQHNWRLFTQGTSFPQQWRLLFPLG